MAISWFLFKHFHSHIALSESETPIKLIINSNSRNRCANCFYSILFFSLQIQKSNHLLWIFSVAKTLIDVNSIRSDRSRFFSAVIRFAFQMNRINNSAKSFHCSFIQFMCQYLLNLANSSCVTCFDSQIVTASKLNEKWKIGALIFLSLKLTTLRALFAMCTLNLHRE